jgi:glycosyltransferase involved in cell wall biosynthesis
MDISIIICTYNPEKRIFSRLLDAIALLDTTSIKSELIIVDNNSDFPVFESFFEELERIKISIHKIFEPESGLTNARIAGFNSSSGEILVFFDDDNEPQSDYIQSVYTEFKKFPNIGVFGPGHISVEFLGNPPSWIVHNKYYFQERHYNHIIFACCADWFEFYPPGTGQSVRRIIFESYYKALKAGRLSAADRKGNSLSSAGDVQLVFESVKMEYAVGVSPNLKLQHLISDRKSTYPYIKRLLFGMSSSFPEAYAECFPETRNILPYYTSFQIFRSLAIELALNLQKKKSPKAAMFLLSDLLGKFYGSNLTREKNVTSIWFYLIKFLKFR